MKIELRRITYNARLSDETSCYAADVWVDGKKRGTVSNSGTGGPDRIDPRELEYEINAYAKTLPPVKTGDGYVLEQCADLIFGELLDRHIVGKALKRQLAKKTIFVRDGHLWQGTPKGPDAVVLNSLPFDDAINLYLSCAEKA